VADVGEHAIIARIRARVPVAPPWVVLGIGDDAAVVTPERNTLDVVTTDALVEHVHFDRIFVPADAIGHKALAVNLSDLAAMGAAPRVAVLSLGLPADLPLAEVDALVDGLLALAARSGVALVGGNITRSPGPLFVDVTVIGSVRPRKVLTRSGARVGDFIYVSGTVGAASAGLARLRRQAGSAGPCEERFLRPEPRLRLGQQLGRQRAATACVDLSDGLADGLRQLAQASSVGALIDADLLPIEASAREWLTAEQQDPVTAALQGGEDYELLFTVSPRRRSRLRAVNRLIGDLQLTRIGTVTGDGALVLTRGGQACPLPEGFAHFR
jgi:thiamine-monophosphate kinase